MAQLIKVARWAEQEPNMNMKFENVGTFRNGVEQLSCEVLYKEIVVLINDTSASLLYNERLHGVSKNNKHWFRFSTPKKVVYTIKKDVRKENVGRMYFKEGRNFVNCSQDIMKSISTVLMDSPNMEGLDIFSIAIRDVASRNGVYIPLNNSITSPTFMYPVLSHLKMPKIYGPRISTNLTRHASTTDLGVFVERAFGKTRYRKDLVKAVANLSSMTVFTLGYSFRGLVPIDWIIDFYRKFANKDPQKLADTIFLKDLHGGLRFLSQKQVRKLFKMTVQDMMHTSRMHFHDTYTSILGIGEEKFTENLHEIKFTTFKEAHDKFATFYQVAVEVARNAKFAEPLELTPLAKDLLDVDSSEHSIRVIPAKYPKDLIEWGGKMNHCIASYTKEAIQGRGTYAAIYQDNKLVGNIEFRNDELTQIFGERNRFVSTEVLVGVVERFLEAGLSFKDFDNCYGLRTFKTTDEYKEICRKYDKIPIEIRLHEPANVGVWQHVGNLQPAHVNPHDVYIANYVAQQPVPNQLLRGNWA